MRLLLCLLIGLHWATASVSATPLPAEVQQALLALKPL